MIDLKNCTVGIELGSTRIKAVLIDENHIPIASGDFEWENQLVDGIWTYALKTVHTGIQTCFANLKQDVEAKFGVKLTTVGAMGVSAMMHLLTMLLSGNVLPLTLFPDSWQRAITALPFAQLLDAPIRLYTGERQLRDASGALGMQALWTVLLISLGLLLWRKNQKRLIVQGG